MPFKINSSEEFERLMEALSHDLVHANIHYRLHRDLQDSVQEYEREFNQSNTFWWLTLNAHFDACLFRLCRAYDQNKNALHLRNWLEIIQENLHLFDIDAFKVRLKENSFVESLAASARKPDPKQLAADIEFASNNNPLVKKLTILRNKVIVHRDIKLLIQDRNFWQEQSLKYAEIDTLLEQGVAILNRHSNLFKALSYSKQIVGHDDYKYVLASIRADRERREAEYEEELRRIQHGRAVT